MPRKQWQITQDFSDGYNYKRDVTQQSPGSLIVGSFNVRITDGDRVGIRNGITRLGASGTEVTGTQSLHTFKKRSGQEILMRTHTTVLEYYHTGTEAWETLNDGYTSDQVFGFANHNVNTEAQDFVYFCNAIEPYSRWNGAFTQLDGALAGSETEIEVDTVLETQVFESGTASSVTTTTLSVAGNPWSADIWNDFYVRITSGAQSGKIAKITDTTADTITFDTISGLSGTPTFEIRLAKFAGSGTIVIGGTDVTYTSLDQDNRFAGCSNTPAASDNAAVAQAVTEYPANPKGNIFLVKDTRMYVSGVKESPTTLYYSAIADATDFTFSGTRLADEGGVIDTPEGGGAITGLGIQEDFIYIVKEDLIKTLTFTQDGNDLPIINTLISAPQVGASFSKGVFEVDNQLYFASKEGGVKSVGRVANIDFVQSLQLSDPIVELVNTLDFTRAAGKFFDQKAYISVKRNDSLQNDIVIVFNYQKNAWEAPITGWNANDFAIYNGELYFASSLTNEVYKFDETVFDDDDGAVLARARFAYNNFGQPALQKKMSNLFVEGYISESTTLTFRIQYNYLGISETVEFELAGTEEQFMLQDFSLNALASDPLGENPLGTTEESENRPNDLQKFRFYVPLQISKFYEITMEVESDQTGAQWEILRHGMDAEITPDLQTNIKKSLT